MWVTRGVFVYVCVLIVTMKVMTRIKNKVSLDANVKITYRSEAKCRVRDIEIIHISLLNVEKFEIKSEQFSQHPCLLQPVVLQFFFSFDSRSNERCWLNFQAICSFSATFFWWIFDFVPKLTWQWFFVCVFGFLFVFLVWN